MDINNDKVIKECMNMIKGNGIEGVRDARNYLSGLYCSEEIRFSTFSNFSHYIDLEEEEIKQLNKI